MGERQRHRTTFAGTPDILCVSVCRDPNLQESRCVVRGPDIMLLGVAHLIEPISELLCLLPLNFLGQSLTQLEEITWVCFHGVRWHEQFA